MTETILNLNFPLIFRTFLAFWCALAISLGFGRKSIALLHAHQTNGQPIRDDGPQSHLQKKGTPTMGGILILLSAILSSLLFADLGNIFVWVCLFVIVVYGFAGFVDDYEKVTKNSSKAMSAKMKLVLQFCAALIAVAVISYATAEDKRYVLNFPYLIDISLNLWIFYVPFAMVVIAGASNGVNLSDGLDGLASGLLIIAFTAFVAVAYYVGGNGAAYVAEIAGAGEVAVVCAAVVGACLGFLWFNAPKAEVFMGDTGSLALGALIGTVAVILKQEILLAIIGGVFVLETISVFLQVFWFKRTGRRIFKMAPIHHHFEVLGWQETKVMVRFWILGLMLAVLGLGSLFIGIGFYD